MPDASLTLDVATMRWEAKRAQASPPWPQPALPVALARGLAGRCPCCGTSRLFGSFLRVVPSCGACGAPVGSVPADDAPPYFTIFIVAHVVVGLLLLSEQLWGPPIWVLSAVFVPMTALLAVGLLQPVKGATVGLMLRLGLVHADGDGTGNV